MRVRFAPWCYAILAVLACAADAAAAPISAIYAFGDSLSDAGNVFLATGGAIPAPPYFAGHFSNGPSWVEDLSQNLGLGTLHPSLAGGTDYAFGGAVTGALPGPSPIPGVPTISGQLGMFFAAGGGVAPSTGLYTVWIGANDIFQAMDGIHANTLTVPAAATSLGQAAQVTAGAIHSLASAGAKNFIVPLIPDIGLTPLVNGDSSAASLATGLTQIYNADLLGDVGALAASDGITIHFLDIFALLDAAVADPSAFGYSDVTDPCYPGSFTGGVPACPNPSSFLFWDIMHPTEPGQERIADLAEVAIPEPPMLMLVLATFALATVLCRALRAEEMRRRVVRVVARRAEDYWVISSRAAVRYSDARPSMSPICSAAINGRISRSISRLAIV